MRDYAVWLTNFVLKFCALVLSIVMVRFYIAYNYFYT